MSGSSRMRWFTFVSAFRLVSEQTPVVHSLGPGLGAGPAEKRSHEIRLEEAPEFRTLRGHATPQVLHQRHPQRLRRPPGGDSHRGDAPHAAENIAQADAIILGRVTWQMMEAAWR